MLPASGQTRAHFSRKKEQPGAQTGQKRRLFLTNVTQRVLRFAIQGQNPAHERWKAIKRVALGLGCVDTSQLTR
jgi:hypothetical protein